mgnify:FL=1
MIRDPAQPRSTLPRLLGCWLFLGVVAFVIAVLFYRYLLQDGDFDVYWAATFRYLHGLQVHVAESNLFTYPTFAALLLMPLYPLGYTTAKVLFFLANVVVLAGALQVCHNQLLAPGRERFVVITLSLIFAVRSILAVFNNQQTDILIFGLIVFGLACFPVRSFKGVGLMAVAAGLKANPLFMFLLPVLTGRWRSAAVFVTVLAGLVMMPDAFKYAVTGTFLASEFSVPGAVLPKNGVVPLGQFKAVPASDEVFGYLKEHYRVTLSASPSKIHWWHDRHSKYAKKNQSLYRILASRLDRSVPSNYVLLGLCVFFGLLLIPLTRRCRGQLFVLGMLYYTAFILIGPQSSKPHFIGFYALLVFCWQDAVLARSVTKLATLAVLSSLMGLKFSVQLLPDGTLAQDSIGLAGLGIWLYSYCLLMSGRAMLGESATEP